MTRPGYGFCEVCQHQKTQVSYAIFRMFYCHKKKTIEKTNEIQKIKKKIKSNPSYKVVFPLSNLSLSIPYTHGVYVSPFPI